MSLPGPFLPNDPEEGLEAFDPFALDDALLASAEDGAERIRLIEFVWETSLGLQPVLYLERQFLD